MSELVVWVASYVIASEGATIIGVYLLDEKAKEICEQHNRSLNFPKEKLIWTLEERHWHSSSGDFDAWYEVSRYPVE